MSLINIILYKKIHLRIELFLLYLSLLNIQALSVPDEGYSRNAPCAPNMISTFQLFFRPRLYISILIYVIIRSLYLLSFLLSQLVLLAKYQLNTFLAIYHGENTLSFGGTTTTPTMMFILLSARSTQLSMIIVRAHETRIRIDTIMTKMSP